MIRLRRIYERFRYKRIVERMHLAACIPCQYDCISCFHGPMRYQFKGYQLSLEDLREFLYFTERSRYLIKKLDISGPGEPLLWKNLTEGMRLLRASPSIRRISITTNGLKLDQIDEQTWANLDTVRFSLYPAFGKGEEALATLGAHRKKVIMTRASQFITMPERGQVAPIPCECSCTGPMYFDRKVLFYCGPTVFGAAEAKGVSVYDYPEMYAEIGRDYLERSVVPRTHTIERTPILNRFIAPVHRLRNEMAHELCRYCCANKNRITSRRDHQAFPILTGSLSVPRVDPGR